MANMPLSQFFYVYLLSVRKMEISNKCGGKLNCQVSDLQADCDCDCEWENITLRRRSTELKMFQETQN